MNKKYEAQAKYDAKYSKMYGLKFNKKTDADIIEKLEEVRQITGIQPYIKKLIRKDILENF